MPICTNQSSTNPVEFFTRGGGGGNDVIFNYVIIEMASLDNPGVRITAWSVNK